jgi:hypothetical protein
MPWCVPLLKHPACGAGTFFLLPLEKFAPCLTNNVEVKAACQIEACCQCNRRAIIFPFFQSLGVRLAPGRWAPLRPSGLSGLMRRGLRLRDREGKYDSEGRLSPDAGASTAGGPKNVRILRCDLPVDHHDRRRPLPTLQGQLVPVGPCWHFYN